MGVGDTLQPAYPNNSHRQDWAYYPFIGGKGGGGTIPVTPSNRYSFWIDFDPFDIKNLKMLSQNVSFQIYGDNLGNTPLIPYFIVDQSNDITDEIITANLPTQTNPSVGYGSASINYPPIGYVDSGSGITFSAFPPVSGAAAPTGVYTALTALGNLTQGTTYYYCITWVNASTFAESLPSAVVSATPTHGNLSIGIGFTPVVGAGYYVVYRNTINNFTAGNGALQVATYTAGQPPYYVNTTFTSQPKSGNFRNDQGTYTLAGYQQNGFGFGSTTMVGQGFVPQQAQLTNAILGAVFHTNTTDPTTYYPLNLELWDSAHNFIQHLGQVQPTFTPITFDPVTGIPTTGSLTGDASCTVHFLDANSIKATDGNWYWTNVDQISFQFTAPVSVTPGTTYYLILRQATLSASAYYALGMNTSNTSIRDPLHYYPFAPAITATDGSSTWSTLVDANSKQITFPFVTQGNIGRYAVTYWWGNLGTVYWPGTPNSKEYAFLHVDYNQRI